MKRMTGDHRYPITLLILAVIGLLTAAPPAYADAPLSVGHEPLHRLLGFPSYFKETGWLGGRLGPVGAYINLRFGVGGKLTELTMNGTGFLDPRAASLWFEGYQDQGKAEMGLGLDAKASYKIELKLTSTLTKTGDIFDANCGVFDTKDFTPYLLGGSSVTLIDDFGPIPIAKKEFEIYMTEKVKVSTKFGLELGVNANNKIEGLRLSTDKGTMTADNERKSVTITRPTTVIGGIVQTSKSTWTLDLTPTVVFTVHFGIDFNFPIEIVTFPLTLQPYEFSTDPQAITFTTGCIDRYYHDSDDDGYGDPSDSMIPVDDCSLPPYYVTNANDCNDAEAAINPAAAEIAMNNIDDDCDGQIDETKVWYRDADGDTYGNPQVTMQGPTQPAGYVTNTLDCNDALASVHPGAVEVFNNIDDDCDGLVDEGQLNTYYRDRDGDGYGDPYDTVQDLAPPAGYVAIGGDCMDVPPLKNPSLAARVYPGALEICDNVDNNCNDEIDENVGFRFYLDADGDGYGNPDMRGIFISCNKVLPVLPGGEPDPSDPDRPPQKEIKYSWNNRDCDDSDMYINPRSPERCSNAKDDNCNGQVDEVCHPPVPDAQTIVTNEDADASIVLSASDADGDTVTFSVLTAPAHGVLSGTAPSMVYTPAPNYYGTDSLTFQAMDSKRLSGNAVVNITVNPVNDRPVANAGPDQRLVVGTTCEATAVMNGAASTDIDAEPLTYTWSWMGMTEGGVNPSITVQEGLYSVALVVNDGKENSLTNDMTITAVDQTPPDVTPPPNVIAECSSPNGQRVAYGMATATDNCCVEEVLASGPELFFPGQSTLLWTGKDCTGNVKTASQTVTVRDATPPALSVSSSPSVLWPPNHEMVEVVPAVAAGDLCCGSNVTVTLLNVKMSEGDGDNTYDPLFDIDPSRGLIGDDIQVVGGRIFLRAERVSTGSGRMYTVTYQATDCVGNIALASSTVTVPHRRLCDVDVDGDIDQVDLALISRARGQTALPGDLRDSDGNGLISPNDVKACIPQCTRPNCAVQ